MNVVAFGSGAGSNLKALIAAQQGSNSYQIRAVLSDRPCPCLEIAKEHGIPQALNDFKTFFRERGATDYRNSQLRAAFDHETVRLLRDLEKREQFTIDLIVLAGYMRLVYPPLLRAFPNRVLNVHPADLQRCLPDGSRKYVGLDAVYQALADGNVETRSTVILVNEEVDGGELIVSGPWVPYIEGEPITRDRARCHQEKQKRLSDWPALVTAVQCIGSGELGRDSRGRLTLNDQVLGPAAVDMEREIKPCVVLSG